jgi:hypothetical protein
MRYGRNLDIRIPPRAEARGSQFLAPSTALAGTQSAGGGSIAFTGGPGQITYPGGLIVQGCAVVADSSAGQDNWGRQYVKLASAGTLTSAQGIFGLALYNYAPAWTAGFDPLLITYADMGFIPLGAPIMVVKGDPAAKYVFTNTVANTFLGSTNYPGRIMVNGFGATATVAVGDYLIPGNGNDVDGYWESTGTATGAWFVITHVDTTRLEVTAQSLF